MSPERDTLVVEPSEREFVVRRVFDAPPEAGHGSMPQGWAGTLNQLADYLAKA
jgi:hypothetical protein